ncbi:ABC transporter substrate-binding protein [Pelomicrobium sp.]|jgi:NitT/TauT family transport system substrate-binding protein|uniref:ABC transporter substrate-binding protein n=1 Tax=Pelomicrobium sp. TaxID=2815319 RepID=UPI003FA72804
MGIPSKERFKAGARRVLGLAGAAMLGLSASAGLAQQTLNFGKPGEPVKLVVGYQPYYTESWSGVVMRSKKFYEKYLPAGSQVEFQIGLQGAIIVNNMLAGKQHIGYMGDMPAIVSTTKQNVADIRIVANLGLGWDQCNAFLVRTDAPQFNSDKEAIQWLSGKQVAVPKGSCTDRFAQAVFKKFNVQPAAYLNQNIEVITSGFRAKKLDAAVIWEPTASRLVEEGLARLVATGRSAQENDGGFLAMRADLIQQRPDVVKAWLQAELDAQLFLADPKNAAEVVKMAQEQTTGFPVKALWKSLYGEHAKEAGGGPERILLHYTITPEAEELLKRATAFLYEIKTIDTPQLRPEAVMPQFTREILKERGLTAPIGVVKAQPESAFQAAFKQ